MYVIPRYASTSIFSRFASLSFVVAYLASPLAAVVAKKNPLQERAEWAKAEQEKAKAEQERAKADQEHSKAEQDKARNALVARVIALSKEEKAKASAERQQIDLEINRVKQRQAARLWALDFVETQDDRHVGTATSNARVLSRWKNVREVAASRFVEFPERSKGAVRSGRALNFFLDMCGTTALNLGMFTQDIDERQKLLESEIVKALHDVKVDPTVPTSISNRIPNVDPPISLLADLIQTPNLAPPIAERLNELGGRRIELAERREILASLGGGRPIRANDLKHLNFTRGQLGAKMTLSLGEEPLELDWPYLIQVEPTLKPYIYDIETMRTDAMANLKAGKRVDAMTADKLTKKVDEFYNVFQSEKLRLYRQGRGAEFNNTLWQTGVFVKTLRSSVAYLICAEDINDIALTKTEGVNNAQTLLAYMVDHGVRFAPSEKMDEDSYAYVYGALIDFYTNIDTMRAISIDEVSQIDSKLGRLDSRQEQLFATEFDSTMNKMISAINDDDQPSALESLERGVDLAQNVTTLWKQWFPTTPQRRQHQR